MALYMSNGVLVLAKNGDHAREILGDPNAPIRRIFEDTTDGCGIVGPDGTLDDGAGGNLDFAAATADDPEPPGDEPTDEEIDVTSLSDPAGVRRFQNKRSKAVRVVNKPE